MASYDYSEYEDAPSGDNAMAALRDLAMQQKEAEAEVARCEDALKDAKETLRAISEQKLPELMDELGIPTFATKDGLKISIRETVHASMGRSDAEKERGLDWLETHGHGAIIKRTVEVPFGRGQDQEANSLRDDLRSKGLRATFERRVESATLRAFVTEMLESGADIPLETFKVHRSRQSKVEV